MERHQFGWVGEVPVVGQGTWNLERGERDGAIAALRRGADLGMTHIDTAEMTETAQPRSWSHRRLPGVETSCSWFRRCCPTTRPGPGPSRPASSR